MLRGFAPKISLAQLTGNVINRRERRLRTASPQLTGCVRISGKNWTHALETIIPHTIRQGKLTKKLQEPSQVTWR